MPRLTQKSLMQAISQAASQGVSLEKACEVLALPRRRYYRWQNWQAPEPRTAWNRLLDQERESILSAARREDLAHLRSAGLMVWGHDTGEFRASLSSVYLTLKKEKLIKSYATPRRKKAAAPNVRRLMDRPLRIMAYDGTDFKTASGVVVEIIPIIDMGSRKFLNFGTAIRAATQEDVKKVWDETLRQEGLADAKGLTILADRGGAMKGRKTRSHLEGKWLATLVYARPYTPDDNAWIESFIKGLKYHPECPEAFETVLDVQAWVRKYQRIYNDHPHSALKYVTPNQEHQGLGNQIRGERKENLAQARQERLEAYRMRKQKDAKYRRMDSGVPEHGGEDYRGSNRKFDGLEKRIVIEKSIITLSREQKRIEAAQAKLLNSSKELCRN